MHDPTAKIVASLPVKKVVKREKSHIASRVKAVANAVIRYPIILPASKKHD